MKIAVHAQVLTAPRLFGIGYYLYNLLNALGKTSSADSFYLFSGEHLRFAPQAPTLFPRVKTAHIPNRCFSYIGFPRMAAKIGCDLAFLPKEVVPFGQKIPSVITAFDLYSLKMPKELKSQFPRSSAVHYQLAKLLHFRRASKILAISEDTKKDLIELCNIPEEKVVVTPLGADPVFFDRVPEEKKETVLKKWQIHSPFFLNTSSYWWGRKNLIRLIHAFARAKKRLSLPHKLVITGKPGPSFQEMQETILKENLGADVKLLSYVDREELVAIMQSATALVFPSLHEGFGLPILEAMAAGCPVVTSQGSAMGEAGGDAALFVDPLDVESIAAQMEKIAIDSQTRELLICKGRERSSQFTWENTAKLTRDAFEAAGREGL